MRLGLFANCLFLAACAGKAATPAGSAPAPQSAVAAVAPPGALARFAGDAALLLPLQGVAPSDPLGWRAKAGPDAALKVRVDSLVETAFRDRGLLQWSYPSALVRAVRRNPTYLADPTALRASIALRAAARNQDKTVGEPLASQLRALAAISGARYALVPMDVRFDSDSAGARGAVRLALSMVDVRTARLVWMGEVASGMQSDFSFTLVDDVIQRAADLVVPR